MSLSNVPAGALSAATQAVQSNPGADSASAATVIGLCVLVASRSLTRSQCPAASVVSRAMTRAAAARAASSSCVPARASIAATCATYASRIGAYASSR